MLHQRRSARLVLAAAAAAGLAVGGVVASPAGAAPPAPAAAPPVDGRYVVVLEDPPATQAAGAGAELRASAAGGARFDAADPAVQEHRERLVTEQRDVAAAADVAPVRHLSLAVNGFTADLTAAQAAQLAKQEGVLAVAPEELLPLDTVASPEFLGLTGPDGVWARTGGVEEAGAGVVVGVLDTGVWPENPSFAGRPVAARPDPDDPFRAYRSRGRIVVDKADGGRFTGTCEAGERFAASTCTDKLVGARAYGEAFAADLEAAGKELAPFEYRSPRDGDGHGSHTAATAAGNHDVPVTIDGRRFGRASGMAPAAKLAAYKVCWTGTTVAGCNTLDILAAIEDAIADGVDVINYSIGGSAATTVVDPVELAFLSAASAGVFVATSAGNDGPAASTLDHASPWLTTVAASTHARYEGTVVLGDGRQFAGASSTVVGAVGPAPLVLADAVAAPGAPAGQAALCAPGTLDRARAAGTIVVCDRGVVDRVAKSAEVERAGGVGMVLVNLVESSLDADLHAVPTVHVNPPATEAVKAYAATAGATAVLREGNLTGVQTPVPQVAGFSSRGPTLAADGDLLKPDLAAPGVSVIAAVSPTNPLHEGRRWDFLSGTSMASPHVAGLAALVLSEHPDWSPMWIKSAMMTTAYDLLGPDGAPAADPFAQGAGHVDPTRFLDPGVVYSSDVPEWLGLVEASEPAIDFPSIEPVAAADVNTPSIAVGALAHTRTVVRTLTALVPGLYTAIPSVEGVDVRVEPSVLLFTEPGQSQSFRVTLTAEPDAPLETYATGSLTWESDSGRSARIPVAVQPVTVDAPLEVSAPASAAGSRTFDVVLGTSDPVDVAVHGPVPGDVTEGSVAVGADVVAEFAVPEGTTLARVDLVAEEQRADLDLFLLDPSGALVAFSATGAADERIDLLAPEPGTYLVVVNGFSSPGGPVPFDLRTFAVGEDDAGGLVVRPDPVDGEAGAAVPVTATWSGLDPSRPHLGWIGWGESPTPTVVSIG